MGRSSRGPKQKGPAFMMRQVTRAGATVLLLVAVLYHPGVAAAHGAASGEDDPCLRRVGERLVHFSAYQPQYELKDQYCTDIPKEGDTFLVVDLVDPALRNEPVGMRVLKGNGSNEAEDQVVADFRPSTHPDGVLRGEVRLDEGLYTVTIAAEKQNLMRRPQYLLRVHMIDYQKIVRTVAAPLIGVVLLALLLYKLVRSKWLRNWWALRRPAARSWCSIIWKMHFARCPPRCGSSRIRAQSRIFRPSRSCTCRPRFIPTARSTSNTTSTSPANSSAWSPWATSRSLYHDSRSL